MIIGVPREIKSHEYRVSLTPAGAGGLVAAGHSVLVEESAGVGSGFSDNDYAQAGAETADRARVFGGAGLIVKVKEPLPEEYGLLSEGQAIFTFLHLAPNRELLNVLLEKRITSLGYETLQVGKTLPLLTPMSEISGRMCPIIASYYLQRPVGGSGVFPAGATGVSPADVMILGAGTVGTNAARMAYALGMNVTVLNRNIEKLKIIDTLYGGQVRTLPATAENIGKEARKADIAVGAAHVPGAATPLLVTADMVAGMAEGSVIVDVSVDQGGCFETTRPTTHDNPVFKAEGVLHYAVSNMPGAYPRTSTLALTNSSLPYIDTLASAGIGRAIRENSPLRSAVNTYDGRVVHKGLAESIGLQYKEIS
jgi:alanine dehydrogenase